MACTVAMQHALSESLLVTMEEWAAKPAALPDALEAVERISELLDLSGLFSALLLHPRRDRKTLSYTGGIRVSGLDFGFPCPYGALESYLTKDGCRVPEILETIFGRRRSTGWLPSPRLGTLAAAAQVLDCAEKPCSEPLMRCLHAARLLIEDDARTLEELQLWGNPLLLRVTREIDGCRVSCKSCPKCGGAVFGQWRGGLLARMPAKKKMSSLHIRNAPRFSPGCSADPQALPWPRSQSPRTAP